VSRIAILAALFAAALPPGGRHADVHSSDGRNWCRVCGGVNACYPWCGKK
jgi:hypothetical protein